MVAPESLRYIKHPPLILTAIFSLPYQAEGDTVGEDAPPPPMVLLAGGMFPIVNVRVVMLRLQNTKAARSWFGFVLHPKSHTQVWGEGVNVNTKVT